MDRLALLFMRQSLHEAFPDSKVHGDNMGPIWSRQDPGGPHVGPMNFIIWVHIRHKRCQEDFIIYRKDTMTYLTFIGTTISWSKDSSASKQLSLSKTLNKSSHIFVMLLSGLSDIFYFKFSICICQNYCCNSPLRLLRYQLVWWADKYHQLQ